MAKSTLDFIKDETRKRCKIFHLDSKTEKKFSRVSPELFHFLYDANRINFTIYFRIENTMIEFMKNSEFSKELLDQVSAALRASNMRLEINVLKTEQSNFTELISTIRKQKIHRLMEMDSALDSKVLDVFSNLSGASQLVIRGGVTREVAEQIKAAASFLVNNLKDNDMAIATLSRMVIHDPTLYDHSASVAMIAGMIATDCMDGKLGQKECEVIAQCGLYHDVGKTCVPSDILNKPGQFTDDEFEIMKTHAKLGEDELNIAIGDGVEKIDPIAARVAGEHHERFHGQGYPRGKQGRFEDDPDNGIHLYTRIVTIADVYSALLMKRVYKPAYEPQDAIKIMAAIAKKEYDPDIFLKFIKKVVTSLNSYQEKANGISKGRLLFFDRDGQLRERKKEVI